MSDKTYTRQEVRELFLEFKDCIWVSKNYSKEYGINEHTFHMAQLYNYLHGKGIVS